MIVWHAKQAVLRLKPKTNKTFKHSEREQSRRRHHHHRG